MGFLFVWMAGCTLGAVVRPEGCLWAGLMMVLLMGGTTPRARRGCLAAAVLLAGLYVGARSAPTGPPLGSPQGWMTAQARVLSSRVVSRGRVQTRLERVRLDGRLIGRPLTVYGPGPCAWPQGASWSGRVLVRATGAPSHRLRWTGVVESSLGARRDCRRAHRPYPHIELASRDTSALLRALTLGDRSGLSSQIRERFVDTGTMHLLAISGLHLGVVAWGIYRLILALVCSLGTVSWSRDNPRIAALGSIIGTWLAVAVVAPSDATLRAAWAVTFVLGGLLAHRGLSAASVIALSAAGVVTLDPQAPLGASFQLSFAAVIAMVQVASWLRRRAARSALEPPGPTGRLWSLARVGWSALALNLAAFAVTAPLALAWFGQVAPISPLVNLVATPWVAAVVVPFAVSWSALASIWPQAAAPLEPALSWTLATLLDGVEAWAELAGSAQSAQWPLPMAILVTVGLLLLPSSGARRHLGLALAALGACGILWASEPPDDWTITAVDVGHGDAVLLRGPRGETALIDAGGHTRDRARATEVTRRRVLPTLARLGVDHLDVLVLTHGDLDHAGGAELVTRRMPVDQIWLSACPQRRIVRRVVQSALVRGTTVVRVAPSGPLAWGDAQLEVLWPPRAQACSLEENDRSLVLSLRTPGGRALFMGDAGRSVERALLMTRGASLAAEVLKVGHHGSAGGSSAVFLQAVGASIGLVSAPGDRPGALPSRAALRRLDDAKVRRWITGVEGTIEVTLSAGSRPRVQTLRTP